MPGSKHAFLKEVTFFMKKDAIHPTVPYLLIPVGIAAVSTASVLIRFSQEFVPSITIAAYRLGLAALILLPYTLIKHGREIRSLTWRDLKFALLAGLLLALHFATWITSLEYTSVASSVVLVTTTPLWVALMAPFFLGEKTPRIAFAGMLIALLGWGEDMPDAGSQNASHHEPGHRINQEIHRFPAVDRPPPGQQQP